MGIFARGRIIFYLVHDNLGKLVGILVTLLTVSTWQALISIDPIRAKDDPVIVRNIPYHKAKKALETEVLKFNPPPRPDNWGVCMFFLSSLVTSSFKYLPWCY